VFLLSAQEAPKGTKTMAGKRPQNSGNRSSVRFGPIVSRRLKAAGFNISPAARRYTHQGIYVRANENRISVTVDTGANAIEIATEIAAEVAGWGFLAEATKGEHNGEHWATVHFTYSA
jgi:hypothetical protein